MSQQFWTPWSLQENCGEGDDFIPFVTRSRTVSRCRSPSASVQWCSGSMGAWSDGTEVEDLTQRGSAGWMQVYEEASPWLLSGQAVERTKSISPSGLGLDRLPYPRELYSRRKGHSRKRRRPRGHSRSTAVLVHLEELKKRQNCINQLKGLKWGSGRSQGSALDMDESLTDRKWQPVECSSNTTETYSSNTEAQEPVMSISCSDQGGVSGYRRSAQFSPTPVTQRNQLGRRLVTGIPRQIQSSMDVSCGEWDTWPRNE